MSLTPISFGFIKDPKDARRVVYLHQTYPDGSHAADCDGCRGKVAAILREWIYDHARDELPETPGEVAARILDALAGDEP